jgi:hypothetical protein
MSADHPTPPPPGRSAWSAAVGIDDGREPWADTVAAREFTTRARAKRWVEETLRSPRALERLRQTQGKDGNPPLLVGSLEQVSYRPVRSTDPEYGLVDDTDREAVDDTQASAFLRADQVTVVWAGEPERPRTAHRPGVHRNREPNRGGGGRAR